METAAWNMHFCWVQCQDGGPHLNPKYRWDNNVNAVFHWCCLSTYKKKQNKECKFGPNAMIRVAVGHSYPECLAFKLAKRPDDRHNYCAGCSLPYSERTLSTRFYNWMNWEAPSSRDWRQIVVRSQPNKHLQRTGPHSDADWISFLRENPVGASEVQTRDL